MILGDVTAGDLLGPKFVLLCEEMDSFVTKASKTVLCLSAWLIFVRFCANHRLSPTFFGTQRLFLG